MSYQYDTEFFDYVNASAGKSASLFIEKLVGISLSNQCPSSVLDVGCGRGIWVAEWLRRGVSSALGVDGDYVSRQTLLVPEENFRAIDISKPFNLTTRFDLVQCLEVAEHVSERAADVLLDSLCRHADMVLFSSATPGQGGEFHVNEQPYAYWRKKFEQRGYSTFDAIRPHISNLRDIEPWYRYNALLFVNDRGQGRLSETAKASLLATGQLTPDIAPLAWKVRCFLISLLPSGVILLAARLKHRAANLARPKAR